MHADCSFRPPLPPYIQACNPVITDPLIYGGSANAGHQEWLCRGLHIRCHSPSLHTQASSNPSAASAQRIIDLSLGISADSLSWGSTEGLGPDFRTLRGQRSKGDVANMSWLRMDAHTATHLDAPSHFVQVCAAPWPWCIEPARRAGCGCICDSGRVTARCLCRASRDAAMTPLSCPVTGSVRLRQGRRVAQPSYAQRCVRHCMRTFQIVPTYRRPSMMRVYCPPAISVSCRLIVRSRCQSHIGCNSSALGQTSHAVYI